MVMKFGVWWMALRFGRITMRPYRNDVAMYRTLWIMFILSHDILDTYRSFRGSPDLLVIMSQGYRPDIRPVALTSQTSPVRTSVS